MLWALAILISAFLYRIPRGGPSGLAIGSFGGALIWAVGSSGAFAVAAGSWWPMVLIVGMLAGESPGWSRWWPNRLDGGNIWKLSLRGCLLANPAMGLIYFGFFRARAMLPTMPYLSGWTEWSELACGLVTASAYAALVAAVMT